MAGDDLRTQKGQNRAGMGWCQGRVCGFAVSCLSGGADPTPGAIETSLANSAVEVSLASPAVETSLAQSAKRPVAQPLPLGALAELD
jgi:hypothetical protein